MSSIQKTVVEQTIKGKKRKVNKCKIFDVTFLYVQLQKAVLKYGENVDKEWVIHFAMTEDQADDWKEAYPKNKVKEIKTAQFEDKYKCAPPFPGEKKQYIGKLAVDAFMKSDTAKFKKLSLIHI